jgi:ATP/maltotriose-dependent transcriptional regulator MalT
MAEDDYGRAAALAARHDERRTENEILEWWCAAKRWGPAPVTEAIAFCRDALERVSGDPHPECAVLAWLASLVAVRGQVDEARELIARSRALADEFGLVLLRGGLSTETAAVELCAGDVDAAEQALRSGWELLGSVGETGFRATVGTALAKVVVERGRLAEAIGIVDEVAAFAGEDDVDPQARMLEVRALVCSGEGEDVEAERLARAAVALTDGVDYIEAQAEALAVLGEVLAAAGKAAEAADALVGARERYVANENLVLAERLAARLSAHA